MKIYRQNTELKDVLISSRAKERKELMVEHTVSLDFELSDYLELKKGDKVVYNSKDFYLNRDYIPQINPNTNGYKYDLTFYDITERFKDFKLKYNLQGVNELEFFITQTPDKILDVVVSTLLESGFGNYTYSISVEGYKELHFDNVDIFTALTMIAEAYNCEWWINGMVIHLGTNETENTVNLNWDEELDKIDVSESSERMITRLYAFGSTRNIPLDYRTTSGSVDNIAERRLRMKNGTEEVDYIEIAGLPTVEGTHIFEDIYPRQKGLITEVQSEFKEGGDGTQDTWIYIVKGNYEINQSDLLPGKPLMIAFQTGKLQGREFEVIVHESPLRYEIKYLQNGDYYLPNPTLLPEIDDEFFFYNFDSSKITGTILSDAENELLQKAQEYLDNLGSDIVWTAKTRSIYCENNEIDLEIGQKINLNLGISSHVSRVRAYEKLLENPFECTYTLGTNKQYSRLADIEKKTDNTKIELKTTIDRTANSLKTDIREFQDWFKRDSQGNIYTDYSFYSTKEISAYGAGGSDDSGANFSRLDAWSLYTNDKSGWVLSALLGKELHDRVLVLEAGGGGGGIGTEIDPTVAAHIKNITTGDITNWSAAYTKSHGHTNISVLNATTASFLTADRNKLDGIAAGANNYTHPATSGNKHIPVGGASGNILRWSADGTASWGVDNDTIYELTKAKVESVLTGAITSHTHAYEASGTTSAAMTAHLNAFAHGNIANGQTAFGWGNHASAGYALNSALSAHIGSNGNAHGLATETTAGFMGSSHFNKLAGIESGANNYTHPTTHAPSIIVQDANNRFVTDSNIASWNAKANGTHTHSFSEIGITGLSENYLTKFNGSTLVNSNLIDNGDSLSVLSENINIYGGKIGYYPATSNFDSGGMNYAYFGLSINTQKIGLSGYYGLALFTGATERISILENGNVGIGTATPTATLDVNGIGKFKDDILMTFKTTAWSYDTSKSLKLFLDKFDIDANGNLVVLTNLYSTGEVTAYSSGTGVSGLKLMGDLDANEKEIINVGAISSLYGLALNAGGTNWFILGDDGIHSMYGEFEGLTSLSAVNLFASSSVTASEFKFGNYSFKQSANGLSICFNGVEQAYITNTGQYVNS